MKTTLFLLAMVITSSLFAQTKIIGGRFTKSDGTRMRPMPKVIFIKGIDDNILLTSYIGGSDNNATLEIELPTGSYVTEFRNMMNTGSATELTMVQKTRSVTPVTMIKQDIGAKTSMATQSYKPEHPTMAKAEITVVNNSPNQVPQDRWVNTIVLEDIKIESCIDDAASGKSKIKLKGSRIGWIYYTYNNQGIRSSTQSGWNTVTGHSWNNF